MNNFLSAYPSILKNNNRLLRNSNELGHALESQQQNYSLPNSLVVSFISWIHLFFSDNMGNNYAGAPGAHNLLNETSVNESCKMDSIDVNRVAGK